MNNTQTFEVNVRINSAYHQLGCKVSINFAVFIVEW